MTPTVEHCRSCSMPIYWATTPTTPSAASMPVNVDPQEDGNVLLSVTASGKLKAVVLARGAEKPPGRHLYTSHFATCSHAAEHRKRGHTRTR